MMPLLPPGWEWVGKVPTNKVTGNSIGDADNDVGAVAKQAWDVWHHLSGVTPEEWKRLNEGAELYGCLESKSVDSLVFNIYGWEAGRNDDVAGMDHNPLEAVRKAMRSLGN